MARLKRGFGYIAKSVALDPTISTTEKAVYVVLTAHADDEGDCFVSITAISNALNVSRRTVERALNGLTDLGIVTRTNRYVEGRQTTNLYTLVDAVVTYGGDTHDGDGGDTGDGDGGVTHVAQNRTTRNKTKKNKDLSAACPRCGVMNEYCSCGGEG